MWINSLFPALLFFCATFQKGFSDCSTTADCSVNELCLNKRCVCKDGYIRDGDPSSCRKITCEDHPCGAIGECEPLEEKPFFQCKCPPDTVGNGYHCYDTPCYSSPCKNGGSCEKEETTKYKCICPIGFSGNNCETMETLSCSNIRLPICKQAQKEDLASMCNNHGNCIQKINQEKSCVNLECECYSGYSGDGCETILNCNSNSCKNGGTCKTTEDPKVCQCEEGFTGVFCEEKAYRSYLHFPRIHFAGIFQTDPSTVNNYANNFETQNTPAYEPNPPGWNPKGSAVWRVVEAHVTRVCYANQRCTSLPFNEPIIHASVTDGNWGASAKLVDLDVEFQFASELYGWSIKIGEFFKGDFQRASFQHLWSTKMNLGRGMGKYGASYQSVLKNIQFGYQADDSPIVRYLKERLGGKKELSIRFNVDMYNSDDSANNFTYVRAVGSIGLSSVNSPPYFTHGRTLKPISNDVYFWFSPFVYEKEDSYVLIDMGNSLAIKPDGNIDVAVGNIRLGLLKQDPQVAIPKCVDVESWFGKTIIHDDLGQYSLTSGIMKIKTQLVNIERRRFILAQVDSSGSCQKVVLAEDVNGISIHPFSRWTFRAEPTEKITVTLFMTKYGTPAADEEYDKINIAISGQKNAPSISPIDTASHTVTFTCKDPQHVRPFIDGQFYQFQYSYAGIEGYRSGETDLNSAIAIVVYDTFTAPTQPNWIRHIQPIFKQYADLYPVMKNHYLDLGNVYDVLKNKHALIRVMTLDIEDPNYMPVTRDLSPKKSEMIVSWLQQKEPKLGFSNLGINLDTLKYLLQTALQLEHATIPPYLAGYLSMKNGYNVEVKSLLKKIMIDEMFHMAQIANILTAIGGNPNLFANNFVLNYPDYLPGGVHPEVKITVNKISLLQIRNVYMVLETPSKELEENGLMKAINEIIKTKGKHAQVQEKAEDKACDLVLSLFNDAVAKSEDIRMNHNTIGQMYTVVLIVMAKLECDGNLAFTNEEKQFEYSNEVVKVNSFRKAIEALNKIILEGEGSSPCNPLEKPDSDVSHYYKFASIANKRYVKTLEYNKEEPEPPELSGSCDAGQDNVDKETEHPELFGTRGACRENVYVKPNTYTRENTPDPETDVEKDCEKATFAYTGRRLPFNQEGVWPTVNNPSMSMYKKGSKAHLLASSFEQTYFHLLQTLQKVFDGNTFLFNDAMAIMKELLMVGNRLVQTPVDENGDPNVGPNAGPIFPST